MAATLYFDVRQAVRNLRALRGRARPTVARAINKSAMSVRTTAAREISADLGLRVGTVRDELRLTRATPQHLAATLAVSGRRIPLIEFHATGPEPSRGRGRGVSYRIGGTRARIAGAFIATMRSGHRGVFKRVGTSATKSAGAWSRNLPIVELMGPSLPHVFGKPAIVRAMQERYRDALLTNLEHEIEFELRRLSGS